jgi:hypothetical protein
VVSRELKRLKAKTGALRAYPWLVSGTLVHKQQFGRLFFVGKESNLHFYMNLLFDGDTHVEALGRQPFWQLLRAVKDNRHEAAISLFSGSQLSVQAYRSARFPQYFVPDWLLGEASTREPAKRKSQTISSDLRRITRSGLWYRTSSDRSEAERFYQDMYLPYVQQRYQQAAVEMQWAALQKKLDAGYLEILYVMYEQHSIAGTVIDFSGGLPRLWSVGVRDADPRWLSMGVNAATYYFSAQWLRSLGYSKYDTGLTRSFIRDGAFRFKSKWGNRILEGSESGALMTLYMDEGEQWEFFKEHPLVCQRGENLFRVTDGQASDSVMRSLDEQGVLEHDAEMPPQPSAEVRGKSCLRDGSENFRDLLRASCKRFLLLACLGYRTRRILFYADESFDPLLKTELESGCRDLEITCSWQLLPRGRAQEDAEAQLVQAYEAFPAEVVVEASSHCFCPSALWQLMRDRGSRAIGIGSLSAQDFERVYDSLDIFSTARLERMLARQLKSALTVRICCPQGTEVRMDMQPRVLDELLVKFGLSVRQSISVYCSAGYLTQESRHAFLHGKLAFLGLPRTVHGRFVCAGYVGTQNEAKPLDGTLTATIRAGRIIDVEGPEQLVQLLNMAGDSRQARVENFGIGLLAGAHFESGIMLAERLFGAVTLRFDTYPHHCDWVSPEASIWLDGEPLFEDGKLVKSGLRMPLIAALENSWSP